jgi:hypothetical protein
MYYVQHSVFGLLSSSSLPLPPPPPSPFYLLLLSSSSSSFLPPPLLFFSCLLLSCFILLPLSPSLPWLFRVSGAKCRFSFLFYRIVIATDTWLYRLSPLTQEIFSSVCVCVCVCVCECLVCCLLRNFYLTTLAHRKTGRMAKMAERGDT